MRETAAELDSLQELLDRSHRSSSEHLRGIITDDRRLSARDVAALLTGMRVVAVATVTAHGEPRISALDGHFLHGTWAFSSSGTSAKARHLAVRPGVSVAHVDGEELAVFSHGRAERLNDTDPRWETTLAHLTEHYGSSPLDWGDDIRLYRLRPHWMVGYAWHRTRLLRDRGLDP